MDLVRHLAYFTAIAHERHFGRAAQRLGMRQPPLSQGLRRLESELGVRLFDRDSQGVTLTDAGTALLPAAHRVLDEVEQLQLLARRQETPTRERCTVRVAPGLGARHYAALVTACRRAVPSADVDVSEQSTADQVQDLLQGRADIGILREPVAARGLTWGARVVVPLRCLMPADHPAAAAGRVRLRDLSGFELILPPRDQAPAAHDELVAACERHGFLAGKVSGVADDRLVHGLVASGGQVSFTTDAPSAGEGAAIVPIDDEPLVLTLRVAWRGTLDVHVRSLPQTIVGALTRRHASPTVHPGRTPRAASELPAEPA
ncbi:LysR family transcriptional regulator [Phytoactinopolyspora alkaliphila]|uniref:LysR family transcriptional regulator n=1 Tax=Phytoactinopolyspora alkaliphila TaxID=1783498 RepID=A0A6N9YTG2_9ACTN|nr:LysR family transcriptional regulator [Phytoactinopolyspora alkaliphila]